MHILDQLLSMSNKIVLIINFHANMYTKYFKFVSVYLSLPGYNELWVSCHSWIQLFVSGTLPIQGKIEIYIYKHKYKMYKRNILFHKTKFHLFYKGIDKTCFEVFLLMWRVFHKEGSVGPMDLGSLIILIHNLKNV